MEEIKINTTIPEDTSDRLLACVDSLYERFRHDEDFSSVILSKEQFMEHILQTAVEKMVDLMENLQDDEQPNSLLH
jgi:hypothetical protein